MAHAADSSPAGVSPVFWRLVLDERLAGLTVLDVGTGAGRLALALAPLARRVHGIDRDASALLDARARAEELGLANVSFAHVDAEATEYETFAPDMVVAYLCMSEAVVERAARALATGRVLAFVAFHADQWRETGRRSRFAYDEAEMRRVLQSTGFVVEHLAVERDVTAFASSDAALAAVAALEPRWRADGRWEAYVEFVRRGGRTLTRSHLVVKARRG